MAKILYVEDEQNIARFVELELEHEAHEVTLCDNGREGLKLALEGHFDLMLLDIMLPGLNGMEVLRRLRQQSALPVILLTAKDDVSDRVFGLDSGADDYLTKPFAIEELLARMRRILRKTTEAERLEHGKLRLNAATYEVNFAGESIELTKTEFELLHYFMQNVGRVLSRDMIMSQVWGYDFSGDTNNVDVYVRYLRAKLDEHYKVKYIHTIRGVGYRFAEEK